MRCGLRRASGMREIGEKNREEGDVGMCRTARDERGRPWCGRRAIIAPMRWILQVWASVFVTRTHCGFAV
jgi:hypothetical protein